MFDTLYAQLGAVLIIGVGAFALFKGDEPERIGAGAYVIAWFATLLVQDDTGLYEIPWRLFVIDGIILLIFCGIAWKSRRSWPIWATAFQLLPLMSHIMTRVDLRPSASAFYAVGNLASAGILICLALGAFWAWQDRVAAGLE